MRAPAHASTTRCTAGSATVEERIQSGPRGEIFTTLEKLASQSRREGRLDGAAHRRRRATRTARPRCRWRSKSVTLAQVVNYLHRIDSSAQVLSIKSLRIRTRTDKPELLDVTFTVSSFERDLSAMRRAAALMRGGAARDRSLLLLALLLAARFPLRPFPRAAPRGRRARATGAEIEVGGLSGSGSASRGRRSSRAACRCAGPARPSSTLDAVRAAPRVVVRLAARAPALARRASGAGRARRRRRGRRPDRVRGRVERAGRSSSCPRRCSAAQGAAARPALDAEVELARSTAAWVGSAELDRRRGQRRSARACPSRSPSSALEARARVSPGARHARRAAALEGPLRDGQRRGARPAPAAAPSRPGRWTSTSRSSMSIRRCGGYLGPLGIPVAPDGRARLTRHGLARPPPISVALR